MYHYQFHVRDYLTKTRHLTCLEDLAYRRLLDVYYTEEQPLPASPEACARLIAMRDHQGEVKAVLEEFFTLAEDGWHNDRADEEISAYHGRAERARTNGRLGGRRKTDWEPTGNPAGTDQPSESKANRKPRTENQPSPVDLGLFDQFWSAYPRKVAKPEAMKAWLKLKPDAELAGKIIAGVEAAKQSRDWTKDDGQFIPHPSTFLNQHRWEDFAGAESVDHFEGIL